MGFHEVLDENAPAALGWQPRDFRPNLGFGESEFSFRDVGAIDASDGRRVAKLRAKCERERPNAKNPYSHWWVLLAFSGTIRPWRIRKVRTTCRRF
jgi:hypothetical protein